MSSKVKAKPDQYHTVTASLTIKGADKAIDWYKKVLGAKLLSRMGTPDGKSVGHAEIQIGDSIVMLADEDPQMGPRSPKTVGATTTVLHVYTEKVDDLYSRAIAAGATSGHPPMDMFWGDRYGQIIDPFGHVWGLATHTEDVPENQMEQRGREWAASRP